MSKGLDQRNDGGVQEIALKRKDGYTLSAGARTDYDARAAMNKKRDNLTGQISRSRSQIRPTTRGHNYPNDHEQHVACNTCRWQQFAHEMQRLKRFNGQLIVRESWELPIHASFYRPEGHPNQLASNAQIRHNRVVHRPWSEATTIYNNVTPNAPHRCN